jgi:hypothetical protein
MKSFILITFGLLGFAFYEMSDGADFDANALRVSRVDAAPAIEETQLASAQTDTPVVTAEPKLEQNEVSRGAVTLAALSTTTDAGTRVSATLTPAVATTTATEEAEPASQLILPSLIAATDQPATEAVPTSLEQETQAIIRTIAGNRVNVRGGPGTNYDVVSRMVKGQEVEILSDPGQGWVKMRPVDGGSVGWLADFLLNES